MEFQLHAEHTADGERKSYGSVHLRKQTDERSARVLDAFSLFQRALPYVIVVWLISFFGCRWLSAPQVPAPLAVPSPAPAVADSRPQCTAYRYPQCESALHFYLSAGATSRCTAFERVKAEGDLVQAPFLAASAACSEPGCCGCPGQCSKCPPILPECVTWRLDGSWRVALQDGTEVQYTVDAHGHCEIRQPAASLPKMWKRYTGAYVGNGNDVLVFDGTLQDAQARCKQYAACRSLVYDASKFSPQGVGQIFLKSATDLVIVPGTGWVSWVADQHPNLVGEAAVAGPLVPVPGDALGKDSFRIDLHRAAPHLFPEGSQDVLTVGADGGLLVQRHLGLAQEPAHEQLTGVGISVHSA